MTFWLGVAAADHVRRGVTLEFAQIGHGKRGGLARMRAGDSLVYYSPRASLDDPKPTLRAFTAIGLIPDDEIWQADDGDFQPWRRRVDYVADAVEVPLASLHGALDLTRDPHWGYQLRRGLIELSAPDHALIHAAMTGSNPRV